MRGWLFLDLCGCTLAFAAGCISTYAHPIRDAAPKRSVLTASSADLRPARDRSAQPDLGKENENCLYAVETIAPGWSCPPRLFHIIPFAIGGACPNRMGTKIC